MHRTAVFKCLLEPITALFSLLGAESVHILHSPYPTLGPANIVLNSEVAEVSTSQKVNIH